MEARGLRRRHPRRGARAGEDREEVCGYGLRGRLGPGWCAGRGGGGGVAGDGEGDGEGQLQRQGNRPPEPQAEHPLSTASVTVVTEDDKTVLVATSLCPGCWAMEICDLVYVLFCG